MRLHSFLLVAAATILASTDVFSASTDFAQSKLSPAILTAAAPAASSLDGAKKNGNGQRSLRTSKMADEDEVEADEDSDNDEDDEERGITVLSASTTAKALRKFLKEHRIISKQTSKNLKMSGLSVDEIASMHAKYVRLG
ncbi:hypothetical protein PHYBOEH_005558 [Phytophthora boehmeriae]|uniref:RxLR effector protein n=1 Tax=Phytophthora boehmeriae TaxID=109152 RepID=A0A8T1WNY4_9STRA|nr:hypothetical protein PHYBOEH_005558 [Phytophthora boehmeriae]